MKQITIYPDQIGRARPDEPPEALLLCAWGAAEGAREHWREEALTWPELGPPPARQWGQRKREAA